MNKNDLKKKLKELSKNELIDLLLSLNIKHTKSFFDERFSELDYKTIKSIIYSYAKKASKNGYVPSYKAMEAYEGVYVVLEKIDSLENKVDRVISIFYIFDAVLNLTNIDDSNGDLTHIMDILCSTIEEFIKNEIFSTDEKTDIIDNAFTILTKDNYYGINDFRDAVLMVLTRLCIDEKTYNRFDKYLNLLIKLAKEEDSKNTFCYHTQYVLLIKYNLINNYNNIDGKAFLIKNLKYDIFVEAYVKRLLSEEFFEETIKICNKYMNDNKRSLNNVLLESKLSAAEKLNYLDVVRDVSLKLLIDKKFMFYETYKKTFNKKEFILEIPKLLEYKDSEYYISVRNFVAIKENLQNVMVEDIKEDSSIFYTYHKHLNQDSLYSVKSIYESEINNYFKHSDTRSKYKKACKMIVEFADDYKVYPLTFISEIEMLYSRKPALQEELEEIKMKLMSKY
jgi:hypothetical protein